MKGEYMSKNLFHNIYTWVHNFFFCLKYPFWRAHNVWTGKKLGLSWTNYDSICEGWKKAFGKQLSKDLLVALKKDKLLHKFYFDDVKEKYGTLRLYGNCHGENVSKVTNYYELLSMCYCFICGKPVRYISHGWIEYMCPDCAKQYIHAEHLDSCRTKEKDIPHCVTYRYDSVLKTYVEDESPVSINFKEMWDI